ncbi:NAD(P)-dependent oxidoreductase [Streptomyces viridiviolaceus]|uniref:SDR family NAD(P)-dependent oxidoreductase n=1 Tax=Streptomyces viridiviolaceus TaxID=68282 RepID=A0ABW2EBM6_9ACTN|nr:SDR family NAD(P)-dependent oxidoreductase [Streptomyces viridiviolaceus]GHB67511.1 NAD(P)-dependent oxidoreductase [Streptomyces viridiviolaceus]
MGALAGKTALITGALGDQGRTACRRFCEEGAAVVGTDITQEGAAKFTDELVSAGFDFEFHQADLGSSTQVDALANHVRITRGHIDSVYNNAGVMMVKPIHETTDEEWQRAIRVNLTAPFLVTRAFVPLMKGRTGASICNVSSIGGIRVYPTQMHYGVTKAALLHLTKAAAYELAPDIRVNAICPGVIDTQMAWSYVDASPDPAAAMESLKSNIPLGRMGDPADVINLGVWLAGDQASYVTGAVIIVDGGSTLAAK